jgi:hypothetical protein
LNATKWYRLSYERESKRNFDLTQTTLTSNNISNVSLYNKALYSQVGDIYLAESWTPDQDSVTNIPTDTIADKSILELLIY